MTEENKNPLLEPRLTVDTNKEKLVRNLLIDKPNITKMTSSPLLNQVKNFLPQMAEAELKLNQAVARDGGDAFDVENIANDDNVIEMDIAMVNDDNNRGG